MKILDGSIPLQHIKSPDVKQNVKQEEIKDNLTTGSEKDPEFENADKLKKMKEAFTKGMEAVYAGAEKTSEYLDESPKASGALDTALQFFKTIKAFPKFIYPSLINMTAKEREMALSVLDGLSLKDVGSVKSITMLSSLPGGSGGAGPIPTSPFVILSRSSLQGDANWAKEVITHEIGHARDYDSGLFGLPKLFSESSKSPWGKPPYITDYAANGPGWYPSEWDDFAESFAYYHRNPQELKAKCPEKFERVKELEKSGVLDNLIDNEAFRETGKLMGSIMEKVPFLQNGLAMIAFIGGVVQAYKGLGEMKRAEKTGDEKLKMNATMNFAAGSCFASKLFCIPGMAIEGAKAELNRSIDKKEITPEQANAVVQATVGVIAGPVGRAVNWVISKLPWNKTYEFTEDTFKNLSGKLTEKKFDFINSIKHREFSKGELKNMLRKMNFTEEETDLVKENLSRPKDPDTGGEIYKFNDNTIENLKDKLSEDKLKFVTSLKNTELTEKEIEKKLKKAGFDKGEIALCEAYTEELPPAPDEPEDKDTGSLKRAASIGIGGAAGALTGGFVGPYLGVLGGFAIGGPIGGLVGLIGGAIIGLQLGSYIGGRAGNLTGKVLEKIIDHKKD